MQDLSKSVEECLSEVRSLCAQLKLEELSAEYKNLEDESKSPNFWQSNQKAQATMKRLGQLELRIKPWQEVTLELRELKELIGLDDTSLKQEIFAKLKEIRSRLVVLKGALRFSGTYDDHNAIVSIYAGAGGTDAQDWTQMLLRM